ncbi:MAG: aminotransferase class V-fold PLP-dependent enzyme [Rhizobiaceae bacterium]|nr:aminotransferase class V-fold PLP-dependent enzyme [Rhizobiaceae bacterium]
MSLNFGRTQLAIPGPSVIPERVLSAMHRASPNIYHGELVDMVTTMFPDLKAVARTKHNAAMYIANGHGSWEAALVNVLNPGDKVLVITTGRFGEFWGSVARSLGVETQILDFGLHSAIDPQKLEDVLRADTKGELKAVMTVHVDTATSVLNDIPAVRQAMDNAGHDALLMVDCIASLSCDRFEMDDWGVDVVMTGSQKGLMTPAGMSFVFFNERAAVARKRARPGNYWDWVPRTNPEIFYHQFGGTAPTHHLYGLREALTILVKEEGIEAAWKRHNTIAHAIWAAVDVWGEDGTMHHNIADPVNRSRAVSAISTIPGAAGKIRDWCEFQAGLTLGIGLGLAEPNTPQWDQQFRIGHMGHQNVAMTMSVLGSMETAMAACDIPRGEGALSAAAKVLAGHNSS